MVELDYELYKGFRDELKETTRGIEYHHDSCQCLECFSKGVNGWKGTESII